MKSAVKAAVLALTLSLFPGITAFTPARADIVSNGLELNLDASVAGSYNGTTWFDQSGSGFNATQVNSPTYNASDGSFTFNGTNQYFNLGNVLAKTGAFTLEVTFSPNSTTGTPALVSRQNTGSFGNYFIGIANSKVNHYVESSPWGLRGNATLTSNTKYVATMVYDSSRNVIPYLNGSLNGTATSFATGLISNNINLQIGALLTNGTPSDYFSGKIFSVRMYNRVLTANEIEQNYRAASDVVLSNVSSTTICNWPSNDRYGSLFTAGSTSAIKRIRVQYPGTTSVSNFLLNQMEIYADNSGVMGSLLGTLNAETISAASTFAGSSLTTRVGEYVGSVVVTSGSRFWMVQKSNGGNISACRSENGYITRSSGWAPVLSSSSFNITFGGTYTTHSQFFIFDLEIADVNLTPAIATPTISGAVSKGLQTTISVTSDTAGTVRFFMNGKRIAGCLSRTTTGSSPTFTATCSWRPTVQGVHRVTAQLVTSVQAAAKPISSPLTVNVSRRTTRR